MALAFTTKKFERLSVGRLLSKTRRELKLTIKSVEEKTTIRQHYIKAIENEEYERLPASVYTLGFVHKYATFLNLPPDKITKIFKANLLAWQSRNNPAFSIGAQKLSQKIVITPKLLGGVFALFLTIGFGGYLWYQLRFVTQPPQLVILSPAKHLETSQGSVVVRGKTVAGAQIMINDELVDQDKEGNFSREVKLHPGINNIAILAQNQFDRQSSELIQILKKTSLEQGIDENGLGSNDNIS